MKLQNEQVLETDGDVIGKVIEASVNASDMSRLYWMFSNLYRNVIGSIIREYTSNCFDSHAEAGVDEPVIIRVTESNISFIDKGVGLSPERIEKIFMTYLASTKRDTNTMIGGFGIGSKTGLAYQNSFHIYTVYNGIEYSYILHKGTTGSPVLEELLQIPTDKPNGTEIKIAIKDGDLSSFKDELRIQLTYFDNVYIETQEFPYNNEYVIFEGETFKYRPDSSFKALHLVVGKVAYNLNFQELGISYINCPIAIKLDIGEVQVTPSREDIVYSDATKKLILSKIQAARAELQKKYDEAQVTTDDFVEYVTRRGIKSIDVTFNGPSASYNLKIGDFIHTYELRFNPFVEIGFDPSDDNSFLFNIDNIFSLLFECKSSLLGTGQVRELKYKQNALRNALTGKLDVKLVRVDRSESMSSVKNKYCYQIMKEVYFIYQNKLRLKDVRIWLNSGVPKNVLKLIRDEAYKVILAKSVKYSSIVIPDGWMKSYKEDLKQKRKGFNLGSIPVLEISGGSYSRYTLNTTQLNKFKGIFIVGRHEQKNLLLTLSEHIHRNSSMYNIRQYHPEYRHKCLIICCAEANYKKLIKLENVKTPEQYIKEFPMVLRRAATLSFMKRDPEIKEFEYELNSYSNARYTKNVLGLVKVLKPQLHQTIMDYKNSLSKGYNSYDEFTNELIDFATNNNLLINHMISEVRTAIAEVKKFGIFGKLKHDELNDDDYKELAKLLLIKKFRSNTEFFFTLSPEEERMLENTYESLNN